MGGKFFAARPDRQTVGVEIGAVGTNPTAGTFVHTKMIHCELGALKFTNDAGIGRYLLSIWQVNGNAIVVAPGNHMEPSNQLDIQLSGGAKYGDLGELKPVTFPKDVLTRQGIEVRGDVRAGSATSKLGLFGSLPQRQSTGWHVGSVPDSRNIDGSADLNQVRSVLATLLRELERYGLLGSSSSKS